ncbi:outer membrane beta-barrel protein [Aquimarina litoralis]|uniref:outer membrane beta-barrel protein n=1 Tax=Aquimarina litoralis TaxID=584605 RepID=UPI001C59BD7B|nr:outer membrane beta-barrel protein [Aquimarina litoralis]MBW1294269.1 outer membrane beta-barrel protein [Aquimarina litoralis]
MKTTFLLLITIATFAQIKAQEASEFGFDKGDFTISGTMNYSYQNSDQLRTDINGDIYRQDIKGHNFSLIPEIGYFVSNRIMTGIKIGFISSKAESHDIDEFEYTSKGKGYSAGLFGRYYFSPKKRVSLFMELDAGYRKIKSDFDRVSSIDDPTANSNTNENYNLTAAPGINIFINKNLSLTSRIGSIGYSYRKDSFDNSDGDIWINKREGIDASISLDNFFFGVLYRI